MIYAVDYVIKDQEKYKADAPRLPKYIASTSFADALEKAKSYENDNLSVYELKITLSDGLLMVTDAFKGVA